MATGLSLEQSPQGKIDGRVQQGKENEARIYRHPFHLEGSE
jgi:hypothetical protein